MKTLTIEVENGEDNLRIDRFLSEKLESLSRSYIQKLIKNEGLSVNGKIVKANYKTCAEDVVTLELPDSTVPDIRPENIPLDIIYEDNDILIVNKPKNMVVHPAAGHYEHTLVNALMYHCRERLSGINGVLRPGIVHRIDQNTTGTLVICKNDIAHRALADQFAVHDITRKYRAICIGILPEDEYTIEGNIGRNPRDRKKMAVVSQGGKPAVTHVRVLERLSRGYSYVECTLETGRTHQIRVHMAHIRHPVLGDDVYGPARSPVAHLNGQTLHAMTIGFIHPSTHKYVEFEAPLPDYFNELLKKLSR